MGLLQKKKKLNLIHLHDHQECQFKTQEKHCQMAYLSEFKNSGK